MEKKAIWVAGSLFLLGGLLGLIHFLRTGNSPFISTDLEVFGYDIGGFLSALVLLSIGWGILKLKNSGRIWGLVILWLSLVPNLVYLIGSLIYAISPQIAGAVIRISSLSLRGTEYGLSQDYVFTNPWLIVACSAFVTAFFGMLIYILSSKKNRVYFIAENSTGS